MYFQFKITFHQFQGTYNKCEHKTLPKSKSRGFSKGLRKGKKNEIFKIKGIYFTTLGIIWRPFLWIGGYFGNTIEGLFYWWGTQIWGGFYKRLGYYLWNPVGLGESLWSIQCLKMLVFLKNLTSGILFKNLFRKCSYFYR